MAQPLTGVADRFGHARRAAGEQRLQGRQRQPPASRAVGGAGDSLAGQVRHKLAGHVAEQNLNEEHLDRRHRSQFPLAPTVARFFAGPLDGIVLQFATPTLLELFDNPCDVPQHAGPPWERVRFDHSPFYGGSVLRRAACTAMMAVLKSEPTTLCG